MAKKIKIPTHLAIILDGNGRWALKRGLTRTLGHKAGVEALRKIIRYSFDSGVQVLSVYAFSTENWKRPKEEVDYLFTLPGIYFKEHGDYFIERDCKVIISGDIEELPDEVKDVCHQIMDKTKDCKTHVFNVCFNYGSHAEIIKACKEIANDVKENKIDVDSIDEKMIEDHLYTKGLPPVDLLIRTSNEQRISNFMLWQISYAEFYFVKTLWPAFTPKDLDKAFEAFAKRDRRYGGIKK